MKLRLIREVQYKTTHTAIDRSSAAGVYASGSINDLLKHQFKRHQSSAPASPVAPTQPPLNLGVKPPQRRQDPPVENVPPNQLPHDDTDTHGEGEQIDFLSFNH